MRALHVAMLGALAFVVLFALNNLILTAAISNLDERADRLEEELHRTKQEVCHLQIGHPPDYGDACLYYLGLRKEKED